MLRRLVTGILVLFIGLSSRVAFADQGFIFVGAYAGHGSVLLTPASPFTFASTAVGNSTPQTFTLTNKTANSITISSQPSLAPTTGYAISSNTCPVSPSTLAPNASCTFVVTFTPTSAATFNSTLSETDNGP